MKKIEKIIVRLSNRIRRENKKETYVSPFGESWESYRDRTFTAEEITAANIKAAILGELIKAREENSISQRTLDEFAQLDPDPQLSTLIKVLVPLGKTLKIVPLEPKKTN